VKRSEPSYFLSRLSEGLRAFLAALTSFSLRPLLIHLESMADFLPLSSSLLCLAFRISEKLLELESKKRSEDALFY
jgi:hypothetical protein